MEDTKTRINIRSKEREEYTFKVGDLVINGRFNNIAIIIGFAKNNVKVVLLGYKKITVSLWQKKCTKPWKGTITISNE